MDMSEVVLLEKPTPNMPHCFLWLWYVWEMLPQSLQRQWLTCCFSKKKKCLCLSSAWTTYISQLLQLIVYVHPCYICPWPCKKEPNSKIYSLQPMVQQNKYRIYVTQGQSYVCRCFRASSSAVLRILVPLRHPVLASADKNLPARPCLKPLHIHFMWIFPLPFSLCWLNSTIHLIHARANGYGI